MGRSRYLLALLTGVALLLTGCGRPLSEAEGAFVTGLLGPGLAVDRMRIASTGPKLSDADSPPRRLVPLDQISCEVPPETRVVRPPAAMVLFDTMWISPLLNYDNIMVGWPEQIPLGRAILLAHEATHVWQWQNRALTGYSPVAAASENLRMRDPYAYELQPGKAFLDYGFEQQARIVGDYVCEVTKDPRSARSRALMEVLAPVFGPQIRR